MKKKTITCRVSPISAMITLKYARIVPFFRVPTAQGKQGKLPKKIPVRENTGNLEILPKHREKTGNWFAQVVKVKVKDILKFRKGMV